MAPILSASAGAAAATSPAIAESALCRVYLAKASYDDPDADDAEFLELRIEKTASTSSGGAPSGESPSDGSSCSLDTDGGNDASVASGGAPGASDSGSSGLTLADCGLATLELVNGGAGACEKYRTLAVGEIEVPRDGYVVLCASDSTLVAPVGCTSSMGASTLRNGWLQNGPNDGLRFRDAEGQVQGERGYEGGPLCFSGSTSLRDETGSIVGPVEAEDDVSVLCDAEYRLLPASVVPLRVAPVCAGAALDGGLDARPAYSDAAWTPEYAPPGAGGTATLGPLGLAGTGGSTFTRQAHVPEPPSCAVAAGGSARGCVPFVAALVALRLRKRPRHSVLRARCRARSGSSRPRSP